jgi:hypothetical protein
MKKKDQEAIAKLYTEGFDDYTGGHNNPEMDGGAYDDEKEHDPRIIAKNTHEILKLVSKASLLVSDSSHILHDDATKVESLLRQVGDILRKRMTNSVDNFRPND